MVEMFSGVDDVPLAASVWGDDAAPPVLLLHGGGQTRGAWGPAGSRIAARGWRAVALDLRGHGESGWSADGRYDVDLYAADVRAVMAQLGRPAVLVGASLGGMAALVAGGEDAPVRPLGIVLVDVAHRADPDGAQRVVDFMAARPEGFASVEEAADAVAAYVPHRPRPADVERLRRNLRETDDGRLVWHWDPQLLVSMGDGHAALPDGERLLHAARACGAPTLVIRGALSDVLTESIAAEFCAAVPGARRVDVDDAAHMVAGDRNDRFLGALGPFLDEVRET